MRKFSEWLLNEEDPHGLLQAAQTNPKDTLTWQAYADSLEEKGDPHADLVRALATGKRTAKYSSLDQLWQTAPNEMKNALARVSKACHISQFLSNRKTNLTLSQASQIISLMKNPGRDKHRTLSEINRMLNGHGVEMLQSDDFGQRDFTVMYVNTGDNYNATVLYDNVAKRFQLTTLADFVEKNGERYGIG